MAKRKVAAKRELINRTNTQHDDDDASAGGEQCDANL
jgi:hypothetical protein